MDLSDDVVDALVAFMEISDLVILQRVSKMQSFKKYIASIKIHKFWYVKKTQEWINNIIRKCLQLHTFSNRLDMNLNCRHFPCSLQKIEKVSRIKQFVIIEDYITCTQCNFYDIDTALYFSVGSNMKSSEPYVSFLCSGCAKEESSHIFDYYQEPTLYKYVTKKSIE